MISSWLYPQVLSDDHDNGQHVLGASRRACQVATRWFYVHDRLLALPYSRSMWKMDHWPLMNDNMEREEVACLPGVPPGGLRSHPSLGFHVHTGLSHFQDAQCAVADWKTVLQNHCDSLPCQYRCSVRTLPYRFVAVPLCMHTTVYTGYVTEQAQNYKCWRD